MPYLIKILYLIIFLSPLPVWAYSSGGDIVITRKAAQQKALLDRKFIFMQEQASFKKEQVVVKTPPSLVSSLKPMQKQVLKKQSSLATSPAKSETWDDYAEEVEIEEDLSVQAKLIP